MKYTLRKSFIDVIGHIWWPNGVACSLRINVSSHDVENMRDDDGKLTRESVEQWVSTHSGDFSHVIDFRADIEDGEETVEIDWADPESENIYLDTIASED